MCCCSEHGGADKCTMLYNVILRSPFWAVSCRRMSAGAAPKGKLRVKSSIYNWVGWRPSDRAAGVQARVAGGDGAHGVGLVVCLILCGQYAAQRWPFCTEFLLDEIYHSETGF